MDTIKIHSGNSEWMTELYGTQTAKHINEYLNYQKRTITWGTAKLNPFGKILGDIDSLASTKGGDTDYFERIAN